MWWHLLQVPGFYVSIESLVLQPHLGSQASGTPFDRGLFGSGLMSPAPV